MSRYRVLQALSRTVQSLFTVPVLYFLSNWPIWLGRQSFSHDTGDGLAAFKFAQIIPRHWNWFESAGQPYWFDMAIFRLHDPLMLPVLIPLKLLPLDTFTAFGIFILIRVCALGVGVGLLAHALGFQWKTRQLAVFLVLFGSLGVSVYEQLGMLDLSLTFVFISWALLRLAQTSHGKYLAALGLVVLHGSSSYHILLLPPVFLLLGFCAFFLFRDGLTALLKALRKHWTGVLVVGVSSLLIFLSVYFTAKEEGILPILRNMTYTAFVDESGNNVSRNIYRGRNLFDAERMVIGNEGCNKTMHCSEYETRFLSTFVDPKPIHPEPPWAEYMGFIGRLSLLIAFLGLFLSRRKLAAAFGAGLGLAFILSFGTKTPMWPLIQKALPPLMFVRHTHFYLALVVLFLIGLFCLGWERLEKRFSSSSSLILGLTLIVVGEVLFFYFSMGSILRLPIYEEQQALVAKPLPTKIGSRIVRVWNPHAIPRSGAATGYGFPAAIESVTNKVPRPPRMSDVDFIDLRLVGYPTPFVLRHSLASRLMVSPNGEAFKRAFGVHPYGVFSLYPWKSAFYDGTRQEPTVAAMAQGKILLAPEMKPLQPTTGLAAETPRLVIPVEIQDELLVAKVDVTTPMVAYFAVPRPHIASVLLNGEKITFFKANVFGLAFPLGAGHHEITVVPSLSTKRKVVPLYYSAAFLLIIYFLMEIRKGEASRVAISGRKELLGKWWKAART